MAIGHFPFFFFAIIFSVLWIEGTKGSDLDGGLRDVGKQRAYIEMERIIL